MADRQSEPEKEGPNFTQLRRAWLASSAGRGMSDFAADWSKDLHGHLAHGSPQGHHVPEVYKESLEQGCHFVFGIRFRVGYAGALRAIGPLFKPDCANGPSAAPSPAVAKLLKVPSAVLPRREISRLPN